MLQKALPVFIFWLDTIPFHTLISWHSEPLEFS